MADVKVKLKLANGNDLTVGTQYVTNIKSTVQSTPDASTLNYGVLANSGSITIQDGKGYISDMIDNGTLPISNLDAKIEIDGTIFQQHITTDSDYDTENNELSISLSNFVKDFDELKYKGYKYPDTSPYSRTVYQLFYDVLYSYYYSQYPSATYPDFIDNMFTSSALTYIKAITIDYPVIEYGKTYREVLDDLCTIAQLSMYTDNQNKPKFVSIRPVYKSSEQINILLWKNIVDSLKYTKTVKNKYDGVEINKYNVKDTIDIDSNLFTWNSLDYTKTQYTNNDIYSDTTTVLGTTAKKKATVYATFYTASFSFSKKSDDNLSSILSVKSGVDLSGNPNIKYSVSYTKNTGDAELQYYLEEVEPTPHYTSTTYGNDAISQYTNITQSIPSTYGGGSASVSDDTNLKTLSVITDPDDNTKYKVTFTILVGYSKLYCVYNDTLMTVFSSYSENVYPTKVELSIYGNKRTITFTDTSASTTNIENCKTKAVVNSNELLQNTTKYNNTEIAEVIKTNILQDYISGISDATLSLNKKLYEIGDLVKYPENNKVWRITGVNFEYDGGIKYPYELMENKPELISYSYVSNDNAYTVYSISNDISGNVTISSTYNDGTHGTLNVTSIKEDAFWGKTNITSVSIPNTITKIGNNAFYGCTGLTSITIPSGVTSIGSNAFNGCTSLTSASLSSNITSISYGLFMGCTSLSSVSIPSGVTSIGELSFSRCNISSISLPYGLTSIGSNAFEYTQITSLLIPVSVTNIYASSYNNSPFFGCNSSLVITCEAVSKPSGWGTYWNYYSSSQKLKTIWNNLSYTEVDNEYQVTGVVDSDATEIYIPDVYNNKQVTSISASAFSGNNKLLKAVIGDNVTEIGDSAFSTCRNLLSVTLGESVSTIGTGSFNNCNKLVEVYNLSTLSITIGSTDNGYVGYYANDIYTSISSNSKITYTDDDFIMYENGSGATRTYTLLGYIGTEADITLPWIYKATSPFYYEYDVINFAFAYNTTIQSVTIIEHTATSLGNTMFYNCSNLQTFDLQANITSLPNDCFSGCTSITNFRVKDGITTIGEAVFYGCTSLVSVYIPSSVTTISASAFYSSPFRSSNSSAIIYCGASSKPSDWGTYWNYYSAQSQLSVVWGYSSSNYNS